MELQRITVVGNGGAGKTTLSQKLSKQLELPLHHMDQIIWQPNWGRTPDQEIKARLERIIAEPLWLIDGLGPLWTIEMRLPAADLIICLDYPLEHCKAWAMDRIDEFKNKERPDAPEGCSFNGMEDRLLTLLDHVDQEFLPVIRQWLAEPRYAAKAVILHSPDELEGLYTLVRGAPPIA